MFQISSLFILYLSVLTIANGNVNDTSIHLDSTSDLCAYDRIKVSLFIDAIRMTDESSVWVGMYDSQSSSSSFIHQWDFSKLGVMYSIEEASIRQSIIYSSGIFCDLGGPSCVTSITTMGWDSEQKRIEINFDVDTNQPKFNETTGFSGMVLLKPMPRFLSTPPFWQTPKKLVVIIDLPQDQETLSEAFLNGTASVKLPDLNDRADSIIMPMKGKFSMRVGEVGRELKLKLWRGEKLLAQSQNFQINDCDGDEHEVILHRLNAPINSQVATVNPDPHWNPRGVFAITGQRALLLPPSALPGDGQASFSLSFWVYIFEPENTLYRPLFFKGTGDSDRTPSAWLDSTSMKLLLRASMGVKFPDLGADSELGIAVKKWTHLTFTFDNSTNQEKPFNYGLYVDGEHYVSIGYPSPVLANEGPLLIGKDPTRIGPTMLVSHPKIWSGALNQIQVLHEYSNSNKYYHGTKKASDVSSPSIEACVSVTTGFSDRVDEDDGSYFGNPLAPALQWGDRVLEKEVTRQSSEALMRQANLWIERGSDDMDASFSLPSPSSRYVKEGEKRGGGGDEESLKLMRAASEVHWQNAMESECDDFDVRLSAFESAAKLGHKQGNDSVFAAVTGNLYLYGVERMEGFGNCVRNGGPKYSGQNTAKGLLYLKIAAALGDVVSARRFAFLTLSGIGSFALSSSPSSTSTTASSTALLEMSQAVSTANSCLPKVGAGAFDTSQCQVFNPIESPPRRRAGSTMVGVGLLHVAAVMGDVEAHLALAHRYQRGLGVEQSSEAAAFYMAAVAAGTSSQYHSTGRQPSNEMNRLRDGDDVVVQQSGNDDEELRQLIVQAEEGDVSSMNQLAGLMYWGHRGFVRDQVRARQLWDGVAVRGDELGDLDPFPMITTNGRVAAAGMWLKGEGGDANHSRAVELYEKAAAEGSVAALNGLGFAYYHGNHLPQDLPKALGYFTEAASLGSEGDSMFNAGYCHANGLGTTVDLVKATQYYEEAAFKFGHFDAIFDLGNRHLNGQMPNQPRDVDQALRFLTPSATGGDWGLRVREGFDAYLSGQSRRSFLLYAEASEMGYEIAQSNAAYLLDRKLVSSTLLLPDWSTDSKDEEEVMSLWALHFHQRAAEQDNAESFVAIGNAYYHGKGIDNTRGAQSKPNYEAALWWYSRAANAGVAAGAYNLGYMYECGIGTEISEDRAERQYRRAAELLVEEAAKKGGVGVGDWFTQLMFWASMSGLKLKRLLRLYNVEWVIPQGLFGVRGRIQ